MKRNLANKRHRWSAIVPYGCLVTLVLTAVLLRVFIDQRTPIQQLLHDPSVRSDELATIAEAALHFMTDGNDQAPKWQVNKDPLRGIVTVLLFSGKKIRNHPVYSSFAQSLGWASEEHAIIIDSDYLRDVATRLVYLTPLKIENPYEKIALEEELDSHFLIWVIGHELGHEFYHDTSHDFGANAFEAPSPNDSADQFRESRADAFVAKRVSSNPREVVDLSNVLMKILNTNIDARTPKTPFQGPSVALFSHDAVDILAAGSHPEFIVRAARMLAGFSYPPGTQDQYRTFAENFLKRIRSDPAPICTVPILTQPVSADVTVEGERVPPVAYWSPANIRLSPGSYRFTISAPGYREILLQVALPNCTHVKPLDLILATSSPPRAAPTVTPEEQIQARHTAIRNRSSHAADLKRRGQYRAAQWEVEQLMREVPDASKPVFLLSLLLAHTGDVNNAQAEWNHAMALKKLEPPEYSIGAYELGELLEDVKQLKRNLTNNPGDRGLARNLVEDLLDLGRFDEAETLIVRRLNVATCQDRLDFARVQLSQGAVASARVSLTETCAGTRTLRGALALAHAFESKGDTAAAARWFNYAYSHDSDNWNDLVDFLRRQHKPRRAIPCALLAMKKDKGDTSALNAVASLELDLGHPNSARKWYERALTTYINNPDALVGLGRIASLSGQLSESLEFCRRAIMGNNWEEYDAWVCIGDAAKMTGNKAEAYSSYEMATWLEPENTIAILRLRDLYSTEGHRELSELYASFASRSIH